MPDIQPQPPKEAKSTPIAPILTETEKAKIYEEEKLREETRIKLQNKNKSNNCATCLLGIIIIGVILYFVGGSVMKQVNQNIQNVNTSLNQQTDARDQLSNCVAKYEARNNITGAQKCRPLFDEFDACFKKATTSATETSCYNNFVSKMADLMK